MFDAKDPQTSNIILVEILQMVFNGFDQLNSERLSIAKVTWIEHSDS